MPLRASEQLCLYRIVLANIDGACTTAGEG